VRLASAMFAARSLTCFKFRFVSSPLGGVVTTSNRKPPLRIFIWPSFSGKPGWMPCFLPTGADRSPRYHAADHEYDAGYESGHDETTKMTKMKTKSASVNIRSRSATSSC
jgi:hypothetical protein